MGQHRERTVPVHSFQRILRKWFVNKETMTKFLLGLAMFISGIVMVVVPQRIFALILEVAILYFALNGIHMFYSAIKHHKAEDWIYFLCSITASYLLSRYTMLPEWLIRVSFGLYCILSAAANFIQFVLDRINHVRGQKRMLFFAIAYLAVAFTLLFMPEVSTEYLMSSFGIYFILLGSRYLIDAMDIVHPPKKYRWRRKIRVTLPPLLCAFLPDWTLNSINHYIQQPRSAPIMESKSDEKPVLKIMVFAGPKGLQKVGHCCFAFKDIVYSYGNYDAPESGIGKVIGDGCYFNVPIDYYQENMLSSEKNSIFEYGIRISKEQEARIEEQIQNLKNKSFRWYCRIEKEDGYFHFSDYENDYPSRLHYRTGAKFYKIKQGKFRYYWFLGDNCASFIDEILGTVGADILSMRGFITPGTYFDFLENEYAKASSPVISKTVYPNMKAVNAA